MAKIELQLANLNLNKTTSQDNNKVDQPPMLRRITGIDHLLVTKGVPTPRTDEIIFDSNKPTQDVIVLSEAIPNLEVGTINLINHVANQS